MYDELRTQYSVLEAYSAKVDDKVVELEEILESMDQIHTTKPEVESNESEEMQKLRSENEWLKDIIIRFTKEDVSNIREDSLRIPPREVKAATLSLPTKQPSFLIPSTSDGDIPSVQEDMDLKGKLSSTTLQLRKQISSKKIPKLRPSFRESDSHAQPAKREPSQSLKPRPPTDRRSNLDLSLDKKVGFDAILNAGSGGLTDKPPEAPLTDRPSITGSQHPLRTNSIRYYITDQSKQPTTTNNKPVINTALLSSHSDGAIGGRSQVNHESSGSDNFVNDIARRLSGKWSLPEVPKLPQDLLKLSQGKGGGDKELEKDKAEIRKQVEDMRMNLDKIANVVAHLTEKYC